jgi:hypothetical protein
MKKSANPIIFKGQLEDTGREGPPITVMGNMESLDWDNMLSVTNPIIWLNRYVLKQFGFKLTELHDSNIFQ